MRVITPNPRTGRIGQLACGDADRRKRPVERWPHHGMSEARDVFVSWYVCACVQAHSVCVCLCEVCECVRRCARARLFVSKCACVYVIACDCAGVCLCVLMCVCVRARALV